MSEAVTHWLHYKSLTGLNGLLNESSMSVPIGEFLSSHYGREVESEKEHPLFASVGRGRPKQLDFVRVKRGERTWHAAYETKFQTLSFDQIVSDLCRLVCLNQAEGIGNPNKYFVYASRCADDKLLRNGFNTGDKGRLPYFEGILSRGLDEDAECRIIMSELHQKQRKAFEVFAQDYCAKLPSRIVTRRVGFSSSGKYTCVIWRVRSARGTGLKTVEELAN